MGSKKRKWFQKGAFEDGYQFGDVLKTMRATGRDISTNLYAGAAEIAEKAIDAGAYVVGGVGGLFGADKFKNKTEKFIEKDIIDEEKVGTALNDVVGSAGLNGLMDRFVLGEDYKDSYDDYSVLGEKSDSLVQSGGKLAAQIALQTFAGVPWWVTTGVTSFGSGVEESLNKGATYEKAGVNGAIRAGADILTEKLFGGSGLGEKGIFKLDGLTKGITNKTVKAFADWGIDLLANGEEEKLATVFTRLGDMLTTEREYTWKELLTDEKAMDDYIAKFVEYLTGDEAREEYKEARIGGMVLGGGANLGKVSKSVNNKTDYRTGLTANEETVFDKVYESKIAEAENGGNNLTGKQKAVIYDNALHQVKSGEVDIQTIEAALGGEEYSAYKNALGNYNTLQQKLNEIKTADSNAKTQEQVAGEIEQRLEQVKLQADELKNILENKVAQKIDTDNIHLRDRESYLLDSYIKGIRKPIDNILDDTNLLKKIEEKAFVEGLWEDSPNKAKNNVEKSQLESVENIDESGIIEETRILTLDDLTKDVLKTKPPNSRIPSDWIKAGGSIAIDKQGNWIYTDKFGISVKYINGYPDYRGAGAVFQTVNIGRFTNRSIDKRLADKLAPNGPRRKGNVWHHSEDGYTMQEVDGEIHRRFTHKGGHSLWKRKE